MPHSRLLPAECVVKVSELYSVGCDHSPGVARQSARLVDQVPQTVTVNYHRDTQLHDLLQHQRDSVITLLLELSNFFIT